ncbi:hypothetical protein [Staphylococcus pseudoxylosus]|uniref:hypothetical protein n=1 Tax=Staphylococcus pseudoxylosus TaxID=2282419 RepID=UPI002DBFDC5C|nr:hypothetical protein [Staphylococcus pseudoxylosus]MEB6038192.1 hypothetical protein [Staphylococcus pseudoxylosus]
MEQIYETINSMFIEGTPENEEAKEVLESDIYDKVLEILKEEDFPSSVEPSDIEYEIIIINKVSEDDWAEVIDDAVSDEQLDESSSDEDIVAFAFDNYSHYIDVQIDIQSDVMEFKHSTIFADSDYIGELLEEAFDKGEFLETYEDIISVESDEHVRKVYQDIVEQSGEDIPTDIFRKLKVGDDIQVSYDIDTSKIDFEKFAYIYAESMTSHTFVDDYISRGDYYEDLSAFYNSDIDITVTNIEDVLERIKEEKAES